MSDQPNPADFSVNDKPREYECKLRVEGVIYRTIHADSFEEAHAEMKRIAEHLAQDDGYIELDGADDVQAISCSKTPPLFRVFRDGRPMQVSQLKAGDLPREPYENGF